MMTIVEIVAVEPIEITSGAHDGECFLKLVVKTPTAEHPDGETAVMLVRAEKVQHLAIDVTRASVALDAWKRTEMQS